MKILLIIISLTFVYAMAKSQVFYGANVGVIHGKYYSTKTQQIKTGVYDGYLYGNVGYAGKYLVGNLAIGGTFSAMPSIELSGGCKLNFSDNLGIHLLAGYKDEMAVRLHPIKVNSYLFPSTTFRLWIGNFDIESKYVFRKEIYGGNSFEFGIGVIGF